MSVDAAVGAAFARLNARQADAARAFVPGATAVAPGDARDATTSFTLDPLSVALPDRAYAIVRGSGGDALYTSDGSFRLRGGTLVDAGGEAVQGVRADGSLAPIRVDAVDAATGQTASLHVEADGTVSYERATIDPRTGERARRRVVAGRIALARFPAASRMTPIDALHARGPRDVAPFVGVPNDGSFGALQPHRQTSSRVDLDAALIALKEAYLSLDALESARVAKDATVKGAMDLVK